MQRSLTSDNMKSVTCNCCGEVTTGGLTKGKRHWMGAIGDLNLCWKCPLEYKDLLKEAAEMQNAYKDALQEDAVEEEELQKRLTIRSGKRIATPSSDTSTTVPEAKKGKSVESPMDLLHFTSSEQTFRLGKAKRQTAINDDCDERARALTIKFIARFFYRNGIDLNVVRSKSFKMMIKAIGNYGQHLKAPSYHEMRVPLLKKEMEQTKEMLKGLKEKWVRFGCSIILDSWKDKENRTLINFMVNCPYGTMFVKSVDASAYMKTGDKLYQLLDAFVEEIGEKNVVQVITNNGSNYVLAGKLLQAKRENLYWTPCASHCVDLMLQDIGKLPRVKRTIQRGITLLGFIYNHSSILNMMRKFTNKMELVRHGVTRFTTTFLTLQRLNKQKNNLRKMFTSDDWLKSKTSKDALGKRAANTIFTPTFWNGVVYSLKAMRPLVDVLRLVDNVKKPAMGYVYKAMDRAKYAIQGSFNGNEEKYKEIFAIIDKRWECQFHHPLHAAGCFLNPKFFYGSPRTKFDAEVMGGLLQCIERLIPTNEGVDKIINDFSLYRRAGGIFSLEAAKKQRDIIPPAEWWRLYGLSTPNLQAFAIKVLSLTCSAYGCERNWSTFEHIHSKKRSKFEHQKLQDLVFIKYNQALKERFDNRDVIDPILLNDIDDSNEWLVGEMDGDGEATKEELVLGDGTLTWGDVGNVVGAGEPTTFTRQQVRLKKEVTSRPSSSKARNIVENEEEEEADDVESEEDEEEVFKSSSSESNNDKEKLEDPSRPSSSKARNIMEDEEEEEADDVESEQDEEEVFKSSSSESNNDEDNLEDLGDDDSD